MAIELVAHEAAATEPQPVAKEPLPKVTAKKEPGANKAVAKKRVIKANKKHRVPKKSDLESLGSILNELLASELPC